MANSLAKTTTSGKSRRLASGAVGKGERASEDTVPNCWCTSLEFFQKTTIHFSWLLFFLIILFCFRFGMCLEISHSRVSEWVKETGGKEIGDSCYSPYKWALHSSLTLHLKSMWHVCVNFERNFLVPMFRE